MTVLADAKIKEQHDQNQRMIEDIDALTSKGQDRDKLTRMLVLFIKRLRVHCENEERVMMMKGYKYLPSHKDDHARIFETLGLVVQVCNDKNMAVNNQMGKNIERLISEHIEMYDNQMMAYLEKVG